jgi:SAM-dependent methyltransferase
MTSAEQAAGGALVGAMWWYAGAVLEPAQALRRAGIYSPAVEGAADIRPPAPGLGPRFSIEHDRPVLLDAPTDHDELVVEFDRLSEAYDAYVRPFSTPIFTAALQELISLLPADARILDAGCGPGRELRRMARALPAGEVVGVDLAAGMVVSAHRSARAAGIDNTAYFQADVGALPDLFTDSFDAVYNCLAHHHYPDPPAAAAAILRVLRPGGIYAIIDPGPAWYNAISAGLAKQADPGWIGFHTPAQFRALLADAGFARTSWRELLPGFGLCLGQKGEA